MPPNTLNIIDLMTNPLAQAGRTGPFMRLVLAEAAHYGMPPQIVAALDDVAAMLGFYDPLPVGQAAHLSGPLIQWRTDARQPTFERVEDVEALAMKQRALIAFGGAPSDHMVGTAEIVSAMGNLHKESVPEAYYAIFGWASCDVWRQLRLDVDIEAMREERGWAVIEDDDVLRPGGKYHATYITIATNIRRNARDAHQGILRNPRVLLRPIAAQFLEIHAAMLKQAEAEGQTEQAGSIRNAISTIRGMYPDLNSSTEEYQALIDA